RGPLGPRRPEHQARLQDALVRRSHERRRRQGDCRVRADVEVGGRGGLARPPQAMQVRGGQSMATTVTQVQAPPVVTTYRVPGWWAWLTTVDHKRIGILYGTAALVFFLIGGLEALLIRTQLFM